MLRGRGRPYRPPLDSSPWPSVAAGTGARTAWLLGTSRMLRACGAFANRQEFLPKLLDLGIRADNTKLSRWESGSGPIPLQVLEAYEQILELPAQQLRAPARLLAGASSAPSPAGDAEVDSERNLDSLVEAVLSGETCGGDCWVQLADALAQHPAMFLRSSLWHDLATQLISELSRSIGAAYTARLVALHRLIAHPMAHHEVVAAIGQYVTDPHAVRVKDVIAALAQAPSSGGRFLALGLLASDSYAVRCGAARTIAAMQASHAWSESLTPTLEKSIVSLLAEAPDAPELAHADGNADLLRYLDPDARARVLAQIGEDRHHRFVLEHATLTSPATASLIAANVTAAAQQSAPIAGDAPDPMLERLVREALFHAHADRRHRASVLLMASPYASGVGGAMAGLLNADDPLVARRAANLLRFCITPAETAHVLSSPIERPEQVQALALTALGHVPELAEPHVADLLQHTEPSPSASHAEAAVYVLGMHGLTDRLSARDLPPHVESAAAWWRRTGSRVAV